MAENNNAPSASPTYPEELEDLREDVKRLHSEKMALWEKLNFPSASTAVLTDERPEMASMADFLPLAPATWDQDQRNDWAKLQAAEVNKMRWRGFALKLLAASPADQGEPAAWLSPGVAGGCFYVTDRALAEHYGYTRAVYDAPAPNVSSDDLTLLQAIEANQVADWLDDEGGNPRAADVVRHLLSVAKASTSSPASHCDPEALCDGCRCDYSTAMKNQRDAERYRWLTDDLAGAERKIRNALLERIAVMSYSAACAAIDAAMQKESSDD